MGMTNNQFKGYIRLLLRDIDDVIQESDLDKKNKILEQISQDLRAALED